MEAIEVQTATLNELPTNLTRAEAARFLRKHVRSLDRLIASGALMAVRVGGSVLVPKAELARLLAGVPRAA